MPQCTNCLTLRTCGQAGLDNSDDDDTPAPHTHASTGDAEVASRVRVQRHRAETSPMESRRGYRWTVVRFVRVIRLPACARVSRVSRVCPGSPRCLFTGKARLAPEFD